MVGEIYLGVDVRVIISTAEIADSPEPVFTITVEGDDKDRPIEVAKAYKEAYKELTREDKTN